MARLTDDDIARLVAALGQSQSSMSASSDPRPATHAHAPAQSADAARRALQDACAQGRVDQSLSAALTDYLKRPVGCVCRLEAEAAVQAVWRYESRCGDLLWWLDVEPGLGAALADAAIGGNGDPAKLGAGRRVRALVEPIALRFLKCFAQSASVPVPDAAAVLSSSGHQPREAGAAGSCEIGSAQLRWRAGIEQVPGRSRGSAERPDAAGASPDAAAPANESPAAVLAAAIAAGCARLGELTGRRVDPAGLTYELVESPALPPGVLRLALTAPGRAAVVVSADGEAVSALAGAALGASLASGACVGSVVVAGAETVLRSALTAFAERLPNFDANSPRIMRLEESAVPGQAPNYAVKAHLTIDDREVALHLLVPVSIAHGY
ncbi:MAG: hypothetical protein M3T49_09760 [Candidatus Eremiobacteraeota bacterium]|nr:hypothetical protein [Candidatus Eremiobacteraeota bacterium]